MTKRARVGAVHFLDQEVLLDAGADVEILHLGQTPINHPAYFLHLGRGVWVPLTTKAHAIRYRIDPERKRGQATFTERISYAITQQVWTFSHGTMLKAGKRDLTLAEGAARRRDKNEVDEATTARIKIAVDEVRVRFQEMVREAARDQGACQLTKKQAEATGDGVPRPDAEGKAMTEHELQMSNDLAQLCATASAPISHVLRFFAFAHLPPHLRETSMAFAALAVVVASKSSNAETTVALRKLLEAKDAAVRAMLP